MHCPGFIGDTAQQAADDFYPGYAEMFGSIGKERGFAPPSRANFDAMRGPTGAMFVGDTELLGTRVAPIVLNAHPESVGAVAQAA